MKRVTRAVIIITTQYTEPLGFPWLAPRGLGPLAPSEMEMVAPGPGPPVWETV